MASTYKPQGPQHGSADTAAGAAWALLLALRDLRLGGHLPAEEAAMWSPPQGGLRVVEPDDPRAEVIWAPEAGLRPGPNLSSEARDLLDLYLPVCAACARRPMIVGHLGQSVDGQIATAAGDSCYVTGRENLVHLHRMRALCDAVLVGAGTVAADDPRLTTRLVPGPNPVRVILDPQCRLPMDRRVFCDGEASTLVVCEAGKAGAEDPQGPHVVVPRVGDDLSLSALVAALQRRGLHALFVEGGGVTVSRWLNAGLLDRLQIASAPLLIGAGRAGLRLPPAASMKSCRRPAYRVYRMGEDVLWDFDLRTERDPGADGGATAEGPLRLF